MDYGPFGFMEEYNPLFAKWTGYVSRTCALKFLFREPLISLALSLTPSKTNLAEAAVILDS